MTHSVNLKKITNENLISDLRSLVTRERRLIRDMPEVEEKLQKGKMSLTVASQFQDFLKKENKNRRNKQKPKLTQEEKKDLLEKIEGTSARKCEMKLVEINPELALPREKTKPLTPENTFYQFTANKKLHNNIQRLKNLTSHQNPEGSLESLFEKITEIALDKLDPERREKRRRKKLERARPARFNNLSLPASETDRNSTKSPTNGNAAEHLKGKEKPMVISGSPASEPLKARGAGGSPSIERGGSYSRGSLSTLKVDRYIPSILKDKIWVRDKGRCQFKDNKTGKTCGSKHLLELDHKYPFSLGGEHSEKNLRLRCRAHNQGRPPLN